MKTTMVLALALLISQSSFAAGWRSDGTGSFPEAKPTTKWSKEENVIWKTKLPKWSNACATIEGDRIFVCAEPDTILCLSKKDGSILWQATHAFESFLSEEDQAKAKEALPKVTALEAEMKKLGKDLRDLKEIKDEAEKKEKEAPIKKALDNAKKQLEEASKYAPPKTHNGTGYSSPTPACDGKNVLVVFGSGIAVCHSIDGTKKWGRNVGRPTHSWGHSSSPAIVGNKAIIQVTDVLALDIETGKEIWSVPDKQAFGSLVTCKTDGKDLIVTPTGKVINADDGTLLAEGVAKLEYCAPIVVDGIAYFIENGGKAIQLPTIANPQAKELWTTEPKKDRYYASPVYHEGLIYAVTQNGDFSVIDSKDGKVIHSEKLKLNGTCYASVTYSGEKILIGSEGGDTIILEPGREPKEIAKNSLEAYKSSPVFEGSRMYLRTMDHLYCIGE